MTTSCGIVYSQDGANWVSYLNQVLTHTQGDRSCPDIHIRCHKAEDVLLNRSMETVQYYCNANCTCIVVVTPALVQYLREHPDANFSGLLDDPSRAVLFYCGVEEKRVRQKLACRFPHFSQWTGVTCEKISGFVDPILVVINRTSNRCSSGHDSSYESSSDYCDTDSRPVSSQSGDYYIDALSEEHQEVYQIRDSPPYPNGKQPHPVTRDEKIHPGSSSRKTQQDGECHPGVKDLDDLEMKTEKGAGVAVNCILVPNVVDCVVSVATITVSVFTGLLN